MNKLNLEHVAYIAGLVDGEGTITLTRRKKGFNRYLAVTISSTERYLLEYVQKTVGIGNITTKKVYSDKHSPSFTFQVFSRQALDLITEITPHLRTYKNKRAQLAITHYKKLTPRNGKYTPDMLRRREHFIKTFFDVKANL